MAIKAEDLRAAKEVRNRLEQHLQVVDFRLFGSRARGDSSQESDLDLFIEVEQAGRAVEEMVSDITWEIGLKNRLVISPLVFSRYEVEQSPLRISPILRSIKRDGIRV